MEDNIYNLFSDLDPVVVFWFFIQICQNIFQKSFKNLPRIPLLMVSFKKCVRYYCMYNTFLQDGSTLVHLAAKSGQAEVATIFVEKGVPIQMPNKVKRIIFILSRIENHVYQCICCSVSFRIQSECGKIRTRNTSNADTFYAVNGPRTKPLLSKIKFSFTKDIFRKT